MKMDQINVPRGSNQVRYREYSFRTKFLHRGRPYRFSAADSTSEVPIVLRGSPSKRASYVKPEKFNLANAQHYSPLGRLKLPIFSR